MSVSDFRNVSARIFDLLTTQQLDDSVYTIEDIVSLDGQTILSSGSALTQELKEKLVNQKLAKPLETSLATHYLITPQDFIEEANALLQEHAVFKKFFINIKQEVSAMGEVSIAPLPALLLSMSRFHNNNMFRHTVLMTLIARTIGQRMKLDAQNMVMLTQAAQAHDIGELYLDPISSLKKGRLTAEQWKTTMAHAKIGAMLIKHHTDYPAEVARAIYEHHERSDGSGYPRKLIDSQLSLLGKILIVSEMLAGMLLKKALPVRRALLVMNFLPKELPQEVIRAVQSHMVENTLFEHELEDAKVDWSNIKQVAAEFNAIESALNQLQQQLHSIIEAEVIEEAHSKIMKIRRATASLGLDFCLDPFAWESIKDDPIVQLELDVACREVAWRLRDTARDMVLNLGESEHQASAELNSLIEKMAQVSLT